MASMGNEDPAYDWVDDSELSAVETLRRFAALSPAPVDTHAGADAAPATAAARFRIIGNSAVPSGPVTVHCFGLVETG